MPKSDFIIYYELKIPRLRTILVQMFVKVHVLFKMAFLEFRMTFRKDIVFISAQFGLSEGYCFV